MRKIIVAIVLIVIAASLKDSFRYSEFVIVLDLFFIGAIIYLIAALIGFVRKGTGNYSQKLKGNLINTNIAQPAKNNIPAQQLVNNKSLFRKYWLQFFLIIIVIVFFAKQWLGKVSYEGLFFIDNLVKFSVSFPPILAWGLLGLLFGVIYGSFTAWKKYKLTAIINVIPIGIFVLCITILFLVNKPLSSRPDIAVHKMQTMYAYQLARIENSDESFDKNIVYKTESLIDDNNSTAWITDISKADANKEVVFTFNGIENYADKNLQCIGFRIKNGYDKSPQLWANFARVKECLIAYNGTFISGVTVSDNSDYQDIKITPISINVNDKFSIKINSVYPGKKYANRVAITELIPIVQYENF